jgi:hypothetical protein
MDSRKGDFAMNQILILKLSTQHPAEEIKR